MDVSKLPRLSKTEGQAPSSEPAPPAAPIPAQPVPAQPLPAEPIDYRSSAYPPGPRVAEAWISIGLGLIFLFVFPNFTQWWMHRAFHTKLPSFLPIIDNSTGVEVPYAKSIFFMNDLSISIFFYALIVDGIALLLARRKFVVAIALLVMAAAVGLNVVYVCQSFSTNKGFPIISGLAVVLGGYMLWYQWSMFQELRRSPGRQTQR